MLSVRTDSWSVLDRKNAGRMPALPRLSGAGASQIGTDAVAAGFGGFGFLLFVFGELFVGVGEGVAGGEHRVAAACLLLFFLDLAEFMANLTQRGFDGLHFDEQVTDFFQEVVQVERAYYIGKLGRFERAGILATCQFGKNVK